MITVLFLCVVTLLNAALPASAALPLSRPVSSGGSSFESAFAGAFVGADSVPYDAVPLPYQSVLHDALAESSGQTAYAETGESARDFVRRFSLPARGINWGILHQHNAVDIAGACGSGVYAAAAGQVIETKGGWGGGYGNYVDIDHGNGVVTRYAHAEAVLVKAGQMVASGDMIARVGNTGNSTGCHVHFEILGPAAAPNPFAK